MYKGIILSVLASSFFSGLYYYVTLLAPLQGEAIFGWRMLLVWLFITLFIVISGEWQSVKEIGQRIKSRPSFLLPLCASSVLLGVQQWLFLWAPLNGYALDVSLGYFLLPLSMVLVGQWLYHDRLTLLQQVAVVCAVVGVVNELYQMGSMSWTTVLVAAGFPVYFILRRQLGTANLGGLWFDVLLTTPVALYFIYQQNVEIPLSVMPLRLFGLILLLGIISAAAFMCYTTASKILPFSLFGLLSYAEPVLMVVVSLILGEQIQSGQWMTYIPIWGAVMLLIIDGVCMMIRSSQLKK